MVDLTEEQLSYMHNISSLPARVEVNHLRKSINYHIDGIITPLCLGNPKTKSILMSVQGLVEIGRGMYNPTLVAFPLGTRQTRHLSRNRSTSLRMDGQN